MSARERLTLAAALAVALTSSALAPLYRDPGWLVRVLGVVAVVAALGLVTRRSGLPSFLQPVIGVVGVLVYAAVVFAPTTLRFLLLPTGRTAGALNGLLQNGLDDVSALTVPVPSNTGLVLLAVLGVGAIAVVVDLVAVVFDRAAVAGLPLLLLFAIPSTVRQGGVGWLPFALGAAGWLGLLLVEGSDRVGRWGAPLQAGSVPNPDDGSLGRVGRRIGAAALGVAIVLPATLPGLDARLLSGGGDGPGLAGRKGRTSTTYNPITQLRGQLNQPAPTELFRYTTTDAQPDYLRLTTLDKFDGTSWSSSQLKGDPNDDAVQKGVPTPATLDIGRTVAIKDRIAIKSLATKWLPVPFPPTDIAIAGPWVWDHTAETVFSAPNDTSDLRDPYEVTATRVIVPPGSLSDTGSRPRDVAKYAEAVQLTPYVAAEVRKVVAAGTNDFERVEAIQQYFLNSARFTYSTDADAPRLDTKDALERFLRNGKGFCEQYASAMAAMVRSLAIPARVAVGFTPGTKGDSGAYVVTTSEAHAWPEVWFAGTGWIRFEPTPRGGVTTVPAYAQAQPGAVAKPGQDPLRPSAAPSASAKRFGKDIDNQLEPKGQNGQPAAIPGRGGPGGPGLPSVGQTALGMLVLVLPLPALLAVVRRRRRLHSPDALTAWAQLRDDAADLGHRWRPTDSPRAAAGHLRSVRDLGPENPAGSPSAALERVARAAERARYAPPGGELPGDQLGARLAPDVRIVRVALRRTARPAQRWRALLLPPATIAWFSAGIGGRVADLLDGFDNILGRLGRAVRVRSHPRTN